MIAENFTREIGKSTKERTLSPPSRELNQTANFEKSLLDCDTSIKKGTYNARSLTFDGHNNTT